MAEGKRAHWSPRNTGALTAARAVLRAMFTPMRGGGSTVAFTEENRKLWSITGNIFQHHKGLGKCS